MDRELLGNKTVAPLVHMHRRNRRFQQPSRVGKVPTQRGTLAGMCSTQGKDCWQTGGSAGQANAFAVRDQLLALPMGLAVAV